MRVLRLLKWIMLVLPLVLVAAFAIAWWRSDNECAGPRQIHAVRADARAHVLRLRHARRADDRAGREAGAAGDAGPGAGQGRVGESRGLAIDPRHAVRDAARQRPAQAGRHANGRGLCRGRRGGGPTGHPVQGRRRGVRRSQRSAGRVRRRLGGPRYRSQARQHHVRAGGGRCRCRAHRAAGRSAIAGRTGRDNAS